MCNSLCNTSSLGTPGLCQEHNRVLDTPPYFQLSRVTSGAEYHNSHILKWGKNNILKWAVFCLTARRRGHEGSLGICTHSSRLAGGLTRLEEMGSRSHFARSTDIYLRTSITSYIYFLLLLQSFCCHCFQFREQGADAPRLDCA